MRTIFTTLFIILVSFWTSAQEITLHGTLMDSSGKPISFASIMVQGTSIGTESKTDVEFRLSIDSRQNIVLEISEIGYQTLTVPVQKNGKTIINMGTIVLTSKTEQLEGVTVAADEINLLDERLPSQSLRVKTELAKLPQNIQVISGELLQEQNALNMMDNITRNVSGAMMIEHWGHFARINMRGFKLPAFRNGMNVEMPWGPLSEDMTMVERIEFIKGPAGFMLAAGEPGGFYNVVTKQPTKKRVNEISLTAGSYNTFRGTLDSGGKLTKNGALSYRLNAMYQTAETHRDYEKTDRFSILPSLRYDISTKTFITTQFGYHKMKSVIGGAYVFGKPEDFGQFDKDVSHLDEGWPRTDMEEVSIQTNLTHKFNNNWSLSGQHAYYRFEQEGASFWVWGISDEGNALRMLSVWDALSTNQLAQLYTNGSFKTGGITHNILAGGEYRDLEYYPDWFQRGPVDTVTPFNIYNPQYGNAVYPEFDRSQSITERGKASFRSTTTNALYLQDELWMLKNRLRLTLATRYTEAEIINGTTGTKDSKWIPRFGFSADILPALTLYGLYDQSFVPKIGNSKTGEAFEPELATDIETGIKSRLFDDKLKLSLTAYQITKDNVLAADPSDPNFSIQLGEVQSKGVEFDAKGQLYKNLNLTLNYAFTEVFVTEAPNDIGVGTRLAGHAKHMTNGWLTYTFHQGFAKNLGVSLGYQYLVDRASWSWGAANEAILPDYFRLDGGLSWSNERVRVNLNINNILNKHLYSGASYSTYSYWQSEPGTNARITLTYNFL